MNWMFRSIEAAAPGSVRLDDSSPAVWRACRRSSGCAVRIAIGKLLATIGHREAARNNALGQETAHSIGHQEAAPQEGLRNNGQEAARNNSQEAAHSTRIAHLAGRNGHRHRTRRRDQQKAVGRQALGPDMNHKTRQGSRPFRRIRK